MKGLGLLRDRRKNKCEEYGEEYFEFKLKSFEQMLVISMTTISALILGILFIDVINNVHPVFTVIVKSLPFVCGIIFFILWRFAESRDVKLSLTMILYAVNFTAFLVFSFTALFVGGRNVSQTALSLIACMFFVFVVNIFFIDISFTLRFVPTILYILNFVGSMLFVVMQNDFKNAIFISLFVIIESVLFDILGEIYDRNLKKNFSLQKRLEVTAFHDGLTGLCNRQILNHILINEYLPAGKYSLIMADIDFFKKVNDDYSHNKGDEVLKRLAEAIKVSIRTSDYAIRWGGEEFIVLLDTICLEDTITVAKRINKQFSKLNQEDKDGCMPTLSIGCMVCNNNITFQSNIHEADNLLYFVKENGRNNIAVYDYIKEPKLMHVEDKYAKFKGIKDGDDE